MTSNLPQRYQEVVKALIPYLPQPGHQMAVIAIEPALPCLICGNPATIALITPAPDHSPGLAAVPWLAFPICAACEERQIKSQSPA